MSKKRDEINSRIAVAIIIALILLALFFLFRPVMHAPTEEHKLEKSAQGGKVQQTQTATIEIKSPSEVK